MSTRGGQIGNRNAAKEQRLWSDMLRRKLTQDPNQLERIALKVLAEAEEGQPWAVQEIANRLDGKPVQQVDMNGNMNLTRTLRDLTDDELLRIATQHAAQEADTDGQTVQ